MTTIKLSQAKAHLGRYAKEVSTGKSFIISDHNQPVAMLSSVPDEKLGVIPKLGTMEGMARIPDDFDAPMEEFEADFYGEST
jgi:prevent-host-death family protein